MKYLFLLLSFFSLTLYAHKAVTPILPLPEHIKYEDGTFVFLDELRIYAGQAGQTFRYMEAELKKKFGIRVRRADRQADANCLLLNTNRNSRSEAYTLTIKSTYIKIEADSETGVFYALQSLFHCMLDEARFIEEKRKLSACWT